MFINSINYFRAISILFIVAGHCIYIADFSFDTVFRNALFSFINGGTSFFVFISGFLFHHIFYKNFNFKKFYKKKLKNVFLPYLFMSIIPILFYVIIQEPDKKDPLSYLLPHGEGLLQQYIVPILKYLATGAHITAYWYIPFIMIVFLMSPLHVKFIEVHIKKQVLITLLLLIVAMLIHRNDTGRPAIFVFQSVFYFMPVYLFGIICSEKKEFIYAKFSNYKYHILTIGILLVILQTALGSVGNNYKNPFVYQGIDLMIVHKMVFSVFFMLWLHNFESKKNKFLTLIASCSFGIYFIHGIFIILVGKVKEMFNFSFSDNSFITYFLVSLGIFFLSLFSTMVIKKIFPKHSRYLIGS